MDIEEKVREMFPRIKEDKLDELMNLIEAWRDSELVYDVEVPGARVGVETRTVGGLPITFDASGNVTSVEFPDGGHAS